MNCIRTRTAVAMLAIITFVLLTPLASFAKQDPPLTSIEITVNGLGCSTPAGAGGFSVSSFTFGASNTATTTGGGAGAGKANVSDLQVTKAFNECSPALFGAVVTGKHFASAKLVHADGNGNPVLTVDLTDVLITSYQISGSAGPNVPMESVGFAYGKICITDAASGTKLCYDAAASKIS